MDFNTILIVLGVLVIVLVVTHGLWSSRREKTRLFKHKKNLERAANLNDEIDFELDSSDNGVIDKNVIDKKKVNTNAINEKTTDKKAIGRQAVDRKNFDEKKLDNKANSHDIDNKSKATAHSVNAANVNVKGAISENSTTQAIRPSSDIQNNKNYSEEMSLEQAVSKIKISLPNHPQYSAANKTTTTDNVVIDRFEQPQKVKITPRNIAETSIADLEASVDEEGFNSSYQTLRVSLEQASQKQNNSLNINDNKASDKISDVRHQHQTADINSQYETENPVVKTETAAEKIPQDLILLYIVSAENQPFKGEKLISCLENLGFIFGKHNIFHRHVDISAASPVLFSAANLSKSGAFEVQNIEQFYTFGITLFMNLPSRGNNLVNLKTMLHSAEIIARELDGFILNDKKEIFDDRIKADYISRVT